MHSITFKGEVNKKNPLLVKIKLVIYKSNYPSRVEKLLPVTGSLKDWDPKGQRFKGSSSESAQLNLRLAEIYKKYMQVADQWEAERLEWEPSHLKDYMDNPKNLAPSERKILTVSQVYDIKITRLNEEKRHRGGVETTREKYARKFIYSKRNLQKFVKERYGRDFSTYYFSEIDETFLNAYVFAIEQKGIVNNNNGGLRDKLHCLYLVVKEAQRKNIPGADLEMFDCTYAKFKSGEFVPRTIPYSVLLQIERFDRSLLTKKEQEYLDMYLFCFYCGGMAPVDSAYLKWSSIDIKSKRVAYERMKTGKIAKPNFHPNAEAIAMKYKAKCYGDFVLPIFSALHQEESQYKNRLVYYEKQVNAALARISGMIGYEEEIKFYSCRGTYITRMLELGVHPMVIAEHCGNSPEVIYKHYYKNTNFEEVKAVVFSGI